MASVPITSWQIDGEIMETVRDLIFPWVGPGKPNLPLGLRGKAGGGARITAGPKRPHLSVCPPKRRGSLRFLPPNQMRTSSVAPDPAESRGAPPPPQDPSPLRGTLGSSLRSPAEGEGLSAPVFLPGKSHGKRSLAGYSPWGCKRARHDLATKQQRKSSQSPAPAPHPLWSLSDIASNSCALVRGAA